MRNFSVLQVHWNIHVEKFFVNHGSKPSYIFRIVTTARWMGLGYLLQKSKLNPHSSLKTIFGGILWNLAEISVSYCAYKFTSTTNSLPSKIINNGGIFAESSSIALYVIIYGTAKIYTTRMKLREFALSCENLVTYHTTIHTILYSSSCNDEDMFCTGFYIKQHQDFS